MLSLTISHYWTLIVSFRSTNISPLRYEATDKVSERRIDGYLLMRSTFHGSSSATLLLGHSGSTLRIWRR